MGVRELVLGRMAVAITEAAYLELRRRREMQIDIRSVHRSVMTVHSRESASNKYDKSCTC
jgi:hypothetical protein